MDITSLVFLSFLLVTALLYRVAPVSWRCPLLVAASYGFYWSWSGWYALLLLFSTLLAFWTARNRGRVIFAVIAWLFGVLIAVKSVPLFHGRFDIALPIGISYFTFKLASYVIDVHWGKMEPEHRLLPFLAYSSFFPQIVAGPIQRAESFLPQAERPGGASFSDALLGSQRILLGFFKKFVIADNVGEIVNYVYAHLTGASAAPVLPGFYGYPLQLYADFSGLTDIAVGAALLFGIRSPENFNAPFFAASISEFWRRWHMTLTSWLTEYVFTPLRTATREFGNAGLVFSLVVNMVLIGLWHGFRWNFALFGLLHAFYLSVDALSSRWRKRFYRQHPAWDRLSRWYGPVATFHLVAAAMVLFRADTPRAAATVFRGLLAASGPAPAPFLELLERRSHSIWLILGAYALMEGLDYLRRVDQRGSLVATLPRWARWSVYSCTGVSIVFMIMLMLARGQTRNPFLYAVF